MGNACKCGGQRALIAPIQPPKGYTLDPENMVALCAQASVNDTALLARTAVNI